MRKEGEEREVPTGSHMKLDRKVIDFGKNISCSYSMLIFNVFFRLLFFSGLFNFFYFFSGFCYHVCFSSDHPLAS